MRPPTRIVVLTRAAGVLLAHVPVARLGVGIAARVRVVDRRDAGEVLVAQSEAGFVLVAELAEQLRERELDAERFLFVPRRRAQVIAAA
jgi:hypothetical protein